MPRGAPHCVLHGSRPFLTSPAARPGGRKGRYVTPVLGYPTMSLPINAAEPFFFGHSSKWQTAQERSLLQW